MLTNQPTFGGGDDGFLTVLNSGGTATVYSTYLGGSGVDSGSGIALDTSFNVYVRGVTGSPNFPTTAGAFQTTAQGVNDSLRNEDLQHRLHADDRIPNRQAERPMAAQSQVGPR